ncbi:MAG: transcriptional regulator NrdR [Micavibrio sp.]|nr:transcriptional regulator NrdR [Micavibrio sp.]HCK32541.1 transcriptional regulator NrdR [Rhodospirillaceae bacterium]|tara:strand:+ start:146 stop:637 length:492 start_codon:yes stop_codon:yes gene_type:complete
MKCPFCGEIDSQVKDSRPSEDSASIRRRRQCPSCGARFTTFERVQIRELTVVKNDGTTQPFDRDKLMRSIQTPMRKRPVQIEQLEKVVTSIVRQLESSGETEVTTKQIGSMVMDALSTLDQIAYVRYASVYKDFRETTDFNEFLDDIKHLKVVADKAATTSKE